MIRSSTQIFGRSGLGIYRKSLMEPCFVKQDGKPIGLPNDSGINIPSQIEKVSPAQKLYQSDNYLVINKDTDIAVNSDDPTRVTVESQLNYTFPNLIDKTIKHSFRFSHRLDYSTSGVLCLSLNKKAANCLRKAFSNRSVIKHYLALVRGHVTFDEVCVEEPVGRDPTASCHKMCASSDPLCDDPKAAKTTLVKLETGSYMGDPVSKLLLIPHTGRTHQLRVHCAHINHPIVGDYTYSNRTDTIPNRMMLHAFHLATETGLEPIDVTAPDPFLQSLDEHWHPKHTQRTYTDYINSLESNCDKISTEKKKDGDHNLLEKR